MRTESVLSISIITISSLLMAVWAMRETIAFRNTFLILGSLLAIFLIYLEFKSSAHLECLNLQKLFPLICILFFFIWVIVQGIFITPFRGEFLGDLKGTWLRSFLATVLGLGVGFSLLRHPNGLKAIWLGIVLCILVIYGQYVPKALALNSLFAPDYDGYILYGKVNAVLLGSILMAGLMGSFYDALRAQILKNILYSGVALLLAFIFVMYAYVFIFDARSGVALILLLFIVSIIAYGVTHYKSGSLLKKKSHVFMSIIFWAALLLSIYVIGSQQLKHNPGWDHFFEDAYIAVQVDKYTEWQNSNSGLHIYPRTKSGRVVRGNNYERIAWAVAGFHQLSKFPLGIGTLTHPLLKTLRMEGVLATAASTHSGWVDLSLSSGIPGILCLLCCLISIFFNCLRSHGCFKFTGCFMTSSIFILYSVCELSTAHAVEMLFFWLGCLLMLPCKNELPNRVALSE